jgi:SAM-dependent methyltransferase
VLEAGYRNAVCWNSFIIHRAHRTFKKNAINHVGTMRINFEKFRKKWGFPPDYYADAHQDMLSLINRKKEDSFKALFVGCGCGDALCIGGFRFPQAQFRGIEKHPLIAKMGASNADIICGDPETLDLPYKEGEFDYIFIANTLERAHDPEKVLLRLKLFLAPGGKLIVKIPNALNAEVVRDLLGGRFTLKDLGVKDYGNINFFTQNDMYRLFASTGYAPEFVLAISMKELRTENWETFFRELAKIDGIVPRNQFNVYNYIFRLNAAED